MTFSATKSNGKFQIQGKLPLAILCVLKLSDFRFEHTSPTKHPCIVIYHNIKELDLSARFIEQKHPCFEWGIWNKHITLKKNLHIKN
jgi:hypothetical protein